MHEWNYAKLREWDAQHVWHPFSPMRAYRSEGPPIIAGGEGLTLRWPGWGPDSPVLVIDDHHFIDRHYWTRFNIVDDQDGHASQLVFGAFTGQRSLDVPPAPAN